MSSALEADAQRGDSEELMWLPESDVIGVPRRPAT